MKNVLLIILLLSSSICFADTTSSLNLAIPNSAQNYQSDSFDAGDLRCSNAIGSATQLEYGVTGIINSGTNYDPGSPLISDVGVYAKIIIPLGKTAKNRIDCNRLYELELQKKQLELEKLQEEVQQLKSLQLEGN